MTIVNGIEYLTLREVADELDLEYSYVVKLVGIGSIPAIKQGRNRMVERDYVNDMKGRAVLKKVYRRA